MFQKTISLGSGLGSFELQLIELGVVQNLVGVDISEARVRAASKAVPLYLKDRLTFEVKDLETLSQKVEDRVDLIVLKMAFHHIERIEYFVSLFDKVLTDDGVIYFNEYVGPKRFQFAQEEINHCNRILKSLPSEFTKNRNNGTKVVNRPNVKAFIKEDPSEAIRSDEMLPLLQKTFNTVIIRPYGGNIFAWLFSGIMFRFDSRPDLIQKILDEELAILQARTATGNNNSSHHVLAFFQRKSFKKMSNL